MWKCHLSYGLFLQTARININMLVGFRFGPCHHDCGRQGRTVACTVLCNSQWSKGKLAEIELKWRSSCRIGCVELKSRAVPMSANLGSRGSPIGVPWVLWYPTSRWLKNRRNTKTIITFSPYNI